MSAPGYMLVPGADPWVDRGARLRLTLDLARRHLAARYRGSALGFLWSLLHPLLMMAVYTFVFGFVLDLDDPGVPYPAFFLAGLLAWNFLRTAALNAATSVIDAAPLVRQAYFPRAALPIAAVLSNAVNYLAALPLLVLLGLVLGVVPGYGLAWLVPALFLLGGVAAGVGMLAAALAARYRDVLQVLDVAFTAWFFASPVLYPLAWATERLPPALRLLYELNPASGAVELARVAVLGGSPSAEAVVLSAVAAGLCLALGVAVFARLSPSFVEDL